MHPDVLLCSCVSKQLNNLLGSSAANNRIIYHYMMRLPATTSESALSFKRTPSSRSCVGWNERSCNVAVFDQTGAKVTSSSCAKPSAAGTPESGYTDYQVNICWGLLPVGDPSGDGQNTPSDRYIIESGAREITLKLKDAICLDEETVPSQKIGRCRKCG